MPGTITTMAIAAQLVADAIGADQPPVLSAGVGGQEYSEVEKLLNQAQIATIWVSDTEYAVGDVIIPTNGIGQFVVVGFSNGGVSSGQTEPQWPTDFGSIVHDGGVIWQQNGDAPACLWDIRLAIHLGWKRKAALVAHKFDLGLDARDNLRRAQMFDHFMKMAANSAPFGF